MVNSSFRCLSRTLLGGTVATLLAACSALAPAPVDPPHTGFSLESPGRADNALLDKRFGGKNPANPNCLGDNVSPALAWQRPPAGTRSFAIVMDDQAGRAGMGVSHWVAYGIPATSTSMVEGQASGATPGFVIGKNVTGAPIYLGPCPARGNAPQHYVFTLIATSVEPSALAPGLSKTELLDALRGKALGAASLVLRFAQ
jgi:Raf kinase inhibitor-like YbhB/YbcL family protein